MGKAKVNDLIFKELIKRGYSLEGNTRIWNIADSKLWYLTPEQAQAYLDLDSSKDYREATGQKQGEEMIDSFAKEILSFMGDTPFNLVDLGCGNGKKAESLINHLKEIKQEIKVRYCPIDISGHMVEEAIETFKKRDEEILELQYNISDFDNLRNITPLLKKEEYKKNLIILLGNTLGNFEINELLYDIRTSMDKEDMLLLDMIADDGNQEKRANSYAQNERFNDWLIHVPLQLGLEESDVKIGARWNPPRIEVYYEIQKDKKIEFQGKNVQFNKGDQIIVVVGYKYNKEDLNSFLNMHFDYVDLKVSEDKSKIVAICTKK